MIFRKMSEIAPPKASRVKPAPDDIVWHLTLDQIDSGLGRIDRRVYGRASEAGSSSFSFDTGNVLYSKLRPYLNKVVCPDTNGIATTELVPLRPAPSELNREYLCFYLRSHEFLSWASTQVDGAKMPRMKMAAFWEHQVPLPPLNDQIRIARLLGKVEELMTQRKQQLRQLDNLLKSVFLEMFGPNSQGYEAWPLVEIRDLAAKHKGSMRTGPFGSSLLHSEFTNEGDVAVLGIDNAVQNRFAWGERRFISDHKYQELKSYRVYPNDVIITIMGTIGRSAVVPADIPLAINTKHLAAISLDQEIANPLFLSYSIHSSPFILNQLRSKNRGAIMNGLNLGLIKEITIKRPPIALQNTFAQTHTYVEELKAKYQQSFNDLEALYGVLSQQAFKGELNLARVFSPDVQLQEARAVAIEPLSTIAEQDFAINLPVISNLPEAMENPKARELLILQWLEAYRGQLGSMPFSVKHFMATVQAHIAELHPETDFELGANDYEHVKTWVFGALKTRKILQTFDGSANRLQLKGAQA